MVKFGHSKLRKQFSRHDMIADIDIALFDIARGASIDVRFRESGRRCRQGDDDIAGARPYGRDPHARYEITNLLGGRHHLPLLRIGAGCAEGQTSGEQQGRAEPEQNASPSALSIGRPCGAFSVLRSPVRFLLDELV